jgi:hypothetical protein
MCGPVVKFNEAKALDRVVRYRLGLNNSKLYRYVLSNDSVVESQETFDISFKTIRRGFIVQRNSVSMFKPSVACNLYKRFLGDYVSPVVWDPSGGFGARLLGFASVFSAGTYICNEPATQTSSDLSELGRKLEKSGLLKNFQLLQYGSELVVTEVPDQLDMVLTSPPYFDKEKYFEEPSQSWCKFKSEEDWYKGYVLPTVSIAALKIKDTGFVVINVDQQRKDMFVEAAKEAGLYLFEELTLNLGIDHFARKRNGTTPITKHTEPILVFKST